MAGDDKQPAKSFASNGLILAVLIATGTAVYYHPAPLQGARPPVTEMPVHQEAAIEDVEARLWQDPFGAVAKQYSDQLAKEASNKSSTTETTAADAHSKSPLAQLKENEKALVLAVTVPGAPYAESVEWRRRARYAVVSALHIAKFAPKIEDHIGFFRPKTFPAATEDAPPIEPGGSMPLIPPHGDANKKTKHTKPKPEGATPKATPAKPSVSHGTHSVVPYEWFSEDRALVPQSGVQSRILVLWVNEDVLGDSPLQSLSSLVDDLCSSNTVNTCQSDLITIKFLGPNASTTLRAMAEEMINGNKANKDGAAGCPPNLKDLDEYAYGATYFPQYPDKDPVSALKGCINLYRTIATDEVLAQGIVKELQKRGVDPLLRTDPNRQHVALISEWDSFYGRNFPDTMKLAILNPEFVKSKRRLLLGNLPWFYKFSYLSGIDGQTAREAEGKKDGKSAASPEKQSSVVDLLKTQTDAKDDAKSPDRPDGQGQFDYLRRIADDLTSLNEKLRAKGEGSIKAIGVVGGDVFDKLLVLRALRPEFPDALFFTTDLDAALTMPSEREWTRNLIVASSFGLELHRDIQRSIPPFRSNYETSAFLAARLAIRDFQPNKLLQKEKEVLGPNLSHCLAHARIFEITRTGRVLAFPGASADEQTSVDEQDCQKIKDLLVDTNKGDVPTSTAKNPLVTCHANLLTCYAIHPDIPPLYHRFAQNSSAYIGWLFMVIGVLLIASLFFFGNVQQAALPLVGAAAIVSLICGVAFLLPGAAEWMTDHGQGEPLTLQGASIWPTILLRALGVVVSFSLIWQGLRQVDHNLAEVAEALTLPNLIDVKEAMANDRSRGWKKRFASTFSYRLAKDQPEDGNPYELELAWNEYVYRGRFTARCARALIFFVVTIGIWIVLCQIFGWPSFPARNENVRLTYFLVTSITVFLLQLLIFLVLDTTLLCLSLVSELGKGPTAWPTDTKRKYDGRYWLGRGGFRDTRIDHVVDDWIDLVFVLRRTRCINQFIFYPFITIALLLVSTSTLFANYPPDAPLLLTTGVSLMIAFWCALALPRAAEKARDFAKRDIAEAIVRTKGLEDGRIAGQLEALLNSVNSLHEGAFSPFTQQPVVRALLLPLGALGGTALLEFLALPGA